jgi:hypothetical protein
MSMPSVKAGYNQDRLFSYDHHVHARFCREPYAYASEATAVTRTIQHVNIHHVSVSFMMCYIGNECFQYVRSDT